MEVDVASPTESEVQGASYCKYSIVQFLRIRDYMYLYIQVK